MFSFVRNSVAMNTFQYFRDDQNKGQKGFFIKSLHYTGAKKHQKQYNIKYFMLWN